MTAPSSSPDNWAGRRVLVVVAHPDDEVLGCGALLSALPDVRVVQVTDGAPRSGGDCLRLGFERPSDYAAARHAEALAALSLAGLSADRLVCLGMADQEASANLVAIARHLAPLLDRTDIVLTHAFEGGHSDHDAVAFAVRAAHRLHGSSATLVEMPFYYGGAEGWVRQRFLPSPQTDGVAEHVRILSPPERARKARMIAAHATQRETLAGFALDAERFRRTCPITTSSSARMTARSSTSGTAGT